LLRSLRGQVGILVPYRDSAFGVRGAIGRRVGIYEGHDVPIAHESADAAAAASGNAERMIEVAIALAEATCTGVTTKVRTDAEACFPGGRFDMGRRRVVPPLVELLKPLALEPTVRQVGRFAAGLRANPPDDIKVDLRESLDAMAHVGARDDGDQHTAIVDYMRRRRIASPAGQSQILTIHKAKGRAFDHVIIVHCSAGPFPDTEAGCRLLYVAITRARQSVHLLASDTHPSPLLRLAG